MKENFLAEWGISSIAKLNVMPAGYRLAARELRLERALLERRITAYNQVLKEVEVSERELALLMPQGPSSGCSKMYQTRMPSREPGEEPCLTARR